MTTHSRRTPWTLIAAVWMWGAALATLAQAQGIIVSASGPVNRSMGGASTAAPLDAIGALRWNPATISGLPCCEVGFGVDLIWPVLETESSIAGLAAGSTDADPGVTPVPAVGWTHKCKTVPLTYGLGLMGVAGFRTNFPASSTNPVLLPQSNTPGVPGGLGRVYTSSQFLEVCPTLSWTVTDRLSIGISPIAVLGDLAIDPLVVDAPNDADGSGAARYASGRGTRVHWGGGVSIGAFYIANEAWRFGAAIKSPDWMEQFQYQTEDELGNPRVAGFDLDLPMIVSTGVSYSGFADTVIALDLRYFDYENTDGLGDSGFNPDGSLRGLGWDSIFAVATGVQYRLADPLYVRLGYTFNENPAPESLTAVNFAAPLHYQHELHAGGSYRLARNVWMNGAYTYYFPHEITGPIFTPLGEIPGSSVTSRESVHVASLGVTVTY